MSVNPAPTRDPFFINEPVKPLTNTWMMWFEDVFKRLNGNFPEIVSVPPAASSTGKKGTIAIDNDYLYVCIATDTWKRTQLLTW